MANPDGQIQFTEEEADSMVYRLRSPLTSKDGRRLAKRRILVNVFSHIHGPNGNDKALKSLDNRDIDADELCTFFKKKFDLRDKDLKIHCNYKVHEIEEVLDTMEAVKETEQYDVFIFVFLTYLTLSQDKDSDSAEERLVFHDQPDHLDKFIKKISPMKHLRMKPKLFIVQADDLRLKYPNIIYKSEDKVFTEKTVKIPTDADRLVILSTIPQFFAQLDRIDVEELRQSVENAQLSEHGVVTQPSDSIPEPKQRSQEKEPRCSLMIQAVVDVLGDKENANMDFLCLTPRIIGRVQELIEITKLEGDYKDVKLPVPLVNSTFTKFLYLCKDL